MSRMVRIFILVEAISFAGAALIHSGRLLSGYEHHKARVAEGVIAGVLLAGLALTWIRPARLREVGLGVQGFALLGTLVGLFTIAVGVGPRTAPDIAYHIIMVIVLAWGLSILARADRRVYGEG